MGAVLTCSDVILRRHQKPFIEATERAVVVYQMHLQDPVFHLSRSVRIPHPRRVGWTDSVVVLVAWNASMGKLSDQVAGDGAAELPTSRLRRTLSTGIEFGPGDVGVGTKVAVRSLKIPFKVGTHTVLPGIRAQGVRTAHIRLPFIEDWAEINENRIVRVDFADRRIFRRDA
jgi:hypothetical protein